MKATIIFDGICGFCNAYVRFVIRRDPLIRFDFVSSQSSTGKHLLAENQLVGLDSLVLVEAGNLYIKSEAVLRICRQLTGIWRWLWYLHRIPRPLRDRAYDWFAKHRYRFGQHRACPVPTPAERQRIYLS